MDREFSIVFRIPEGMQDFPMEAHVDLRWPAAETVPVKPAVTTALSGPAAMHPGSAEGRLMALFSREDYGDGSAIPLDKDASQFEEKTEALREAGRRWSKTDGAWVRK